LFGVDDVAGWKKIPEEGFTESGMEFKASLTASKCGAN
jgi:hypothetical protein